MARKSRKSIQSVVADVQTATRQFSAALYVRLSNEERFDRANKNSFKNQKAFLLNYVESHPDISIYKIYEDNGNTGTNFDRPAFSEMMYDVSNEKVDCIIVKDLSRFGREHIEMGKYLDYLFPMIGLRFIAINDNYDSYDKIKDNDMIVPFKNIINAVYSKDISRKVISSLSLKQHKGEFLGAYAPYGYKLDENRCFVKDDYAAQIVNSVFDMFINGANMREIARKMTFDGVDTPAVYHYKNGLIKDKNSIGNNLWNGSTVKMMLTNPSYLGHMVQGKTKSLFLETGNKKMMGVDRKAWIIVENTHEAIVSKAKFDAAQKILAENSKPHKRNTVTDNIFQSKLYCGECGSKLVMRHSKRWKFYGCNIHAQYPEKCDFMSINYKTLSTAVFKSIKTYILAMLDFEKAGDNVKGTSQIRQKMQHYETSIRNLTGKLDTVKKQRFDLFRDYIDELIIDEEFNFARERYTSEVDLYEERIKILKNEYESFRKALEPKEWVGRFKRYRSSKHLTKEMIDYFIDRIKISKDQDISIKFKFSKEQLLGKESENYERDIQNSEVPSIVY